MPTVLLLSVANNVVSWQLAVFCACVAWYVYQTLHKNALDKTLKKKVQHVVKSVAADYMAPFGVKAPARLLISKLGSYAVLGECLKIKVYNLYIMLHYPQSFSRPQCSITLVYV